MAPISPSAPIHPPPIPTGEPPSKKRKKKDTHTHHTTTFRRPPHSYLHLRLSTLSAPSSSPAPSSPRDLDPLTIRSLLTPPLQQYLGLTGASINMDILKTEGRDVWIRLEREDVRAVRAALSGWVGSCEGELVPGTVQEEVSKKVKVSWRVVEGKGSLALGVVSGDGQDLFEG